jgi:hypothetical protein
MTAPNLPALPDINPDDPVITFETQQCRTCGEQSGWLRCDPDNPTTWTIDHRQHHGPDHARFYGYTLTRNTMRVFLG